MHENIKLLLAGPGTGKTTSIKKLLEDRQPASVLVLSFTNATISDLIDGFSDSSLSIDSSNCMTLHSMALKVNHLENVQILGSDDAKLLNGYAKRMKLDFNFVCQSFNAITFDGMVTSCADFLESNPAYGSEKIGQYELIVVDEFQDFNSSEIALLKQIFIYGEEIIIMGDDDQSIYEFKDASAAELIALHEDSKVTKLAHENKCYRCPDAVIDAATHLITKNTTRVQKEWLKSGKSGFCNYHQSLTQSETGEFVAGEIKRIVGTEPDASIMVLSPVRFAIEPVVDCLDANSIGYLNLLAAPINDRRHDIRLIRAVCGDKQALNLLLASRSLLTPYRMTRILMIVAAELSKLNCTAETLLSVMLASGYYEDSVTALVTAQPSPLEYLEGDENEDIRECFTDAVTNSDINRVLAKLEKLLLDKTLSSSSKLKLMSIHKSKGLQADYVFIVGLVDGIIPNHERGLAAIEAQRRRVFVAMTRAKKGLYCISTVYWQGKDISHVDKTRFTFQRKNKTWMGQTSQFVNESKQ